MLTLEKLQEIVRHARHVFRTEEVIIAGGAPRDLRNGAPVKDIDIFVNIESFAEDFPARCKRFADWLGAECTMRPSAPEYPDQFDLCDITSAEMHGLIQIIGLYENPIVRRAYQAKSMRLFVSLVSSG